MTDMEAKAREWGKELVAEGWEPKQVSIAVGAYAKGLREGMEEAAKVAEEWHREYHGEGCECEVVRVIAAIREKINE